MYCTAIFYLNAEKGKIVHCKNACALRSCKLVTKNDFIKNNRNRQENR